MIDAYISDKRPIPEPSSVSGEAVELPALVGAKVQLYQAMLEARVNKTELARRMRVHLPQIDRLLNIKHGSKMDQLEAPPSALGRRVEIRLTPTGGPTISREKGLVKAALPSRRHSGVRLRRVHPGVIAAASGGRTRVRKKR